MAQQSNFSSLCRGHLLPKEITNKDEVMKFMEAVDQFERIINDTEQIRIVRMTEEELVGTNEKGGLLDRYFSLSEEGHASLEDIRLGADLVRVGDNRLCLHTLSEYGRPAYNSKHRQPIRAIIDRQKRLPPFLCLTCRVDATLQSYL